MEVGQDGAPSSNSQNVMHIIVKILVVVLSFAALLLLIGSVRTGMMSQAVFGLFERIGTFSVAVFHAVLGIFLMVGKPAGSK